VGHSTSDLSAYVWRTQYQNHEGGSYGELRVRDTWRRVAHTLAEVERSDREVWEERFYGVLEGFRFMPEARTQACVGTQKPVTLFNCFVMGTLGDSADGSSAALREGELTLQQGGGLSYDLSSLLPRGTRARATGAAASGPVSLLERWGALRGELMATLRCDHPDIEEFIEAKHRQGRLSNFTLSVQVTDAFMAAVSSNADWPLVFPVDRLEGATPSGAVLARWPGEAGRVPCTVLRRVPARELWERILRAAYDSAEPGVFFVDAVNQMNNLWYREHLTATNPCGGVPLPPYGACALGSINLTRFVQDPFSERAQLDFRGLSETARTATRMLDNVIDASPFPLPTQAEQARGTRRIGLGFAGLADALAMLGVDYGTERGRATAEKKNKNKS